MPKPTLVDVQQSVWSTNATPKTVTLTTQANDRIVVFGSTSDAGQTLGTPTGNSLTYTLAQSVVVTAYCAVYAWTATDAAGGTAWTLSVARGGETPQINGIIVYVFRDSDGHGASAKTNVAAGEPSLAITTTQADSTVAAINSDWDAEDGDLGGATPRVWRTINSITPTSANGLEKNYFRNSLEYTTYSAIWDDVGSAAAKTTGLSAPAGQKYAIIAVEVKGSAASGRARDTFRASDAAVVRAGRW